MSGAKPPKGEPWIWLTQELLSSDAWRCMGINTSRFVNFLMREYMSRAGTQNGKLKAPHRQLMNYGIGAQYVAEAISEAEGLGLVECRRGGMRVATTYGLTWLPLHDGKPASNRWREYKNAKVAPAPKTKIKNLPAKQQALCRRRWRDVE